MSTGEKIVQIEVGQEMRKSFIDYAMSVIVSRAIPDVRDGLKPVHRRIVYGMYELRLEPTERFRKAAKVVGEVMGNYHPHGDSAIYEALVRLAQPQASRYLVVDGHGNFGDLDNPPAAMRYTECKLAPMAMEMLEDIDKETVDFKSNFDDSREEPTVLPTRVPTLLLNGSSGIAVGMATNIPPHNLTEVCNATIAKVDDPSLDSKALMQWIKGPDFPSGGIIMGTSGIEEAYTTGRGSIPVRGDASIEQLSSGRGTKMGIVVTKLPYMVGPEAFTKRVADLVKDEKITGISDVNDETDRSGLRVVIELKRDANAQVVLNNLYKHTQLQQSFPMNTLALVTDPETGKVRPMTLGLAPILEEFIDHRVRVITRRTQYLLRKAEERAHILEGYLKALENIDEVIKIIRAAETTQEARTKLMDRFKLSEIQANAILEMQLRRLTGLERGKIEAEYKELQAKIADYKEILASRERVNTIIKEELTAVRDKHGDERKTRIEHSADDLDIDRKSLTPNDPMAVFITKQDYIKRIHIDTFKRQRRNTRGVSGVKTKDEDDLKHFFCASMHDKLLVFTNRGRIYSFEVMDIPEAGRGARGLPIINMIQIQQDETVTSVIPVSKFSSEEYFVMLTRGGKIKRVTMDEFQDIRRTGIIAITLEPGDELGWVRASNGKCDVIVGSSDGMCIRFSEDQVRPMGRSARGVGAMDLREGDKIVGFDVIEPTPDACMLVVTNDGFGKRVRLEEFRSQKRTGKGIIGTKFKNSESRLAALRIVNPGEGVIIATSNGIVVRQSTDEISMQGRMATGVRLQQLEENDAVMSVTPIVEPNESALTPEGGAPAGAAESGAADGAADAGADDENGGGIIEAGGDEE